MAEEVGATFSRGACNVAIKESWNDLNCSQAAVVLPRIGTRMFTAIIAIPQVACHNMFVSVISDQDFIVICRGPGISQFNGMYKCRLSTGSFTSKKSSS